MTPSLLRRVLVIALFAMTACAAETETTAMTNETIVTTNGLALDGFDPVSYLDGTPMRGLAAHELSWAGARWRFARAENQARFSRSPESFAPQYGGHCALAMSLGQEAPGSTSAWSIDDGKLYLHNSAVTAFLFKYLPGRMRAADQRWSARQAQSNVQEATDGKASL